MLDPASMVLFLGAALVIAVTPGPGIFYVLARTLAGGRRAGLASSIGTGVGGLVHVGAGALGVSALVLASAEAFTLLKLLGAAYLLYLGIRTWRQARAPLSDLGTLEAPGARPAFKDGILVEAFNPKTALFFLAFIPQFVQPETGNVALQFMLLGLISVFLNTATDVAVTFAAAGLRRRFAESPGPLRWMRKFSAGVLCTLAISLVAARRAG